MFSLNLENRKSISEFLSGIKIFKNVTLQILDFISYVN